jgi:hypothetical protein
MKITPEIKIALDQLIESYGNATQLSKRLRVAHTTVLAWLKPNPPEISGDIWYERLEPLLSGYLSKSSNSISLTGGSIGNVAQNSGRQGAVTQTYAPKGVSTPESSKAEAPSLPEEDRAILEYYRSPENKKARYKLLLEIEELKNPPAPETQKPSTETPTAASKPKEGKAPGGLGALAGTIIGFVKKAINWVVDLVGGQHQQETQESQQQQGSIAITDELSPELIRQLTIGYGSLCAVVSLISTHDLFITGISLLAGMVGIKSAQGFGNQFDAKSKWMQKKLDEVGMPCVDSMRMRSCDNSRDVANDHRPSHCGSTCALLETNRFYRKQLDAFHYGFCADLGNNSIRNLAVAQESSGYHNEAKTENLEGAPPHYMNNLNMQGEGILRPWFKKGGRACLFGLMAQGDRQQAFAGPLFDRGRNAGRNAIPSLPAGLLHRAPRRRVAMRGPLRRQSAPLADVASVRGPRGLQPGLAALLDASHVEADKHSDGRAARCFLRLRQMEGATNARRGTDTR